jgi:peptide/nickel transport system substrate-binding protein
VRSRCWLVLLGCFLAVGLLAAIVAGCGGGTASDEGATTTTVANVPRSVLEGPQGDYLGSETPQYGGTLTMLHNHTPANLGAPWDVMRFADVQLGRYAVENLAGMSEQGQPIPQLATSWDIDDTAKTITFHLREGVKFHDGTVFDATAVKWNLDMQKNGAKTDLKAVTSIEVVDPYTVRVTLSQWDPLFLHKLFSSNVGRMVSPTFAQANPDKVKYHPVGTGPFEFVSYEPDVSLKYKKFADYWQEGLPYLDAVEIRFLADRVTAVRSFQAGEAEFLYNADFNFAPELAAAGNSVKTRVMALYTLAADSANPHSPASDIRVRQAIAYAIDSKTITDGVYGGFAPSTDQLAIKGMSGYNPAIKGYPYDPAKARALLAEVGITPETPWKTTLWHHMDEDRVEFFTVVQEQLAAVGIEVTMRPLPYAQMLEKAQDGWDGLCVFSVSYNTELPYSTMLQQYLSGDAYMKGSVAIPEQFDAAYRAVLPESDMAKREIAYQELNRMAVDDYCIVVPLFGLIGVAATSPDLHDCGYCLKASNEFLPENAWLSGASNPGTTGTTGTSTD